MTDLNALAERVEGLSRPDRLIDYEVHCAFGMDGVGSYGQHPAYTASLDAVVALIERELPWSWRVGNLPSRRHFGQLGTKPYEVIAATPALALLAAFLRARALKED